MLWPLPAQFASQRLDNALHRLQREHVILTEQTVRAPHTRLLVKSLFVIPFISAPALVAQMQTNHKFEVDGIVVDASKAPVPSAELVLNRPGEAVRVTRTGTDGRFAFTGVRSGNVALTVRRMGYVAKTVNVEMPADGAASEVEVSLDEIASDISAVIVESSKGHLDEFYERKANNNFAKFFETKDIRARNPLYLSEIVRTVGGATIETKGIGNRILLRGCQPMVWVDGMRAPGAELDDVARPSDVAAMEVYASNAGLPPEYQDRNNRMCGAIIVWTKNQ